MWINFHFFLEILNVHSMGLSNIKWPPSSFLFSHLLVAYVCVMGKLKTCPFLTSFRCINSLQILFCSLDKSSDASSALDIALVSSSLAELDESESDIFEIFLFAGLDCTFDTFLGAFTRDGKASLRLLWPCIYGLKVMYN